MFFIMFSNVLLPTGELQHHTSSFCDWNFVDTSLGRWNRACMQIGIQVFKESFKGFYRAAIKLFTVGFVGVICQTTLMMFGCKVAAKLIVRSPFRCTPKNQHAWGELSQIFTPPFTEIKGSVKLCSAEKFKRIQGIPLAEFPCFVQLL